MLLLASKKDIIILKNWFWVGFELGFGKTLTDYLQLVTCRLSTINLQLSTVSKL